MSIPLPTPGYASATLPPKQGGLPIEVTVIARLDDGAGDRLIADAATRQRAHARFVDALDESSARIGDIDLANGDASSLYTFAVGANGHPFHRHAGHRVFTAVAGSGGVRLCFSTATDMQLAADPAAFLGNLHRVDIPPDCLFTVRFGGGTWHRFTPLRAAADHPALFAISCHTNELGGALAPEVMHAVRAGEASIPALTELLPASVQAALDAAPGIDSAPSAIRLTLDRLPPARLGRVRTGAAVPADSLLRERWVGTHQHEDGVELVATPPAPHSRSASRALAALLAGFLAQRPRGVSRLMALRNGLVRPLGLRTSPLGCPVSSLLAAHSQQVFAGRFPVLVQRVDDADRCAEVILGADDRHVQFRSCVGVEYLADGRLRCTIATRVRTRNLFGRLYMAIVDPIHRRYIAPALLHHAAAHASRGGWTLDATPSTAENGESAVGIGASMAACRTNRPAAVSIRASANARG